MLWALRNPRPWGQLLAQPLGKTEATLRPDPGLHAPGPTLLWLLVKKTLGKPHLSPQDSLSPSRRKLFPSLLLPQRWLLGSAVSGKQGGKPSPTLQSGEQGALRLAGAVAGNTRFQGAARAHPTRSTTGCPPIPQTLPHTLYALPTYALAPGAPASPHSVRHPPRHVVPASPYVRSGHWRMAAALHVRPPNPSRQGHWPVNCRGSTVRERPARPGRVLVSGPGSQIPAQHTGSRTR